MKQRERLLVLAGDVGGTKTALALCRQEDGTIEREQSFASDEYGDLAEIVAAFLGDGAEKVAAAAFGVAGPVVGRRVRITNLSWTVDADSVSRSLGGAPVRLVNDMEATGRGVLSLSPQVMTPLHPGQERAATRVLVAVGTGLGEAILIWDGTSHRPLATEGGHVSFAPRGDQEIELLRFLAHRFGHVSAERLMAGSGLSNLFAFVTEVEKIEIADAVRQRLGGGDDNALIGAAGVEGSCPACVASVRLFARLLAEHCSDLALATMALGGIYLGGGVVPKLLPVLRDEFPPSFGNAGRMSDLVRAIPVWSVLEPKSGLLGAIELAREAL
jgi:glucokinase